jgi:hypothetical protein
MPGTAQEMVELAGRLGNDPVVTAATDEFRWADGTGVTDDEWRDVLALHAYLLRMRRRDRRSAAQRKAGRLLRQLLAPAQRASLSRLGYFYVTVPSGQTYRLDPRRGHAERVEWHKSRYFARRSYCLHDTDDDGKLPPADVTIAHMLLLLADEAAFLATANESPRDDQLWNGEYLRRMRRRHQQ